MSRNQHHSKLFPLLIPLPSCLLTINFYFYALKKIFFWFAICSGDHELEFRGSFSRNKTISGPVVKLSVMPDPNNPVKLCVEYDSEAILRAGDLFPGVYSLYKNILSLSIKSAHSKLTWLLALCICSVQSNHTL